MDVPFMERARIKSALKFAQEAVDNEDWSGFVVYTNYALALFSKATTPEEPEERMLPHG